MKPRSACRKIANRLSSSFGNTSARPRALPRFWLISIRAFSFASVFTSSRKPVEPEETFSFDMIVERSGGPVVVDHHGFGRQVAATGRRRGKVTSGGPR